MLKSVKNIYVLIMNKIIYYYQTFIGLGKILNQSPKVVTDIMISSIHFGNNLDGSPYIHLNDNIPYSKCFDELWTETLLASEKGIKIHLMLGGAGGAFVDLFNNFDIYYRFLLELINEKKFITGINLDIEESIGLEKTIFLIKRLRKDLGSDFTISLAPVSFALVSNSPGLGGFSYNDLKNSEVGNEIDFLNGQFYGDFTFETYDRIIKNNYNPEEIVIGMLGTNYNEITFKNACDEIRKIYAEYPDFCGAFLWEYCDSPTGETDPEKWAELISQAMKKEKFKQDFIKFFENIKNCFINLGNKIRDFFTDYNL